MELKDINSPETAGARTARARQTAAATRDSWEPAAMAERPSGERTRRSGGGPERARGRLSFFLRLRGETGETLRENREGRMGREAELHIGLAGRRP